MRILIPAGVAIITLWAVAMTAGCGPKSEFVGAAAEGEKLVAKNGCRDCHVIRGEGAEKGPGLDDVVVRIGEVQVRKQINDPKSVNPNTIMPDFGFAEDEQDAIVAYLREIQE